MLQCARPKFEFTAEQFPRERAPVRFPGGECDSFGGLNVARWVALLMPNARLHEMNAGDNSCANCRSPPDVLGSPLIE
jgi:hypothetical protein